MSGSDARNDALPAFVIAYYNAARADMMQRLILREGMLTVFLVSVAALTSVAFAGGATQRYAFFAIPVLGFGVAASYVHHVVAVRALWTYLTTEYQQDVEACLDKSHIPRHFDISLAHSEMKYSRSMRFTGTVALIIVPEILATVAGAVSTGLRGPSVWAFAVSVVAIGGTAAVFLYGYLSRRARRRIAERLRPIRRKAAAGKSPTP